MGAEPRLTTQTLKVLGALMMQPCDALSGAEIGRSTKLHSGTLYPILLRLESAGWLVSNWEEETPQDLGRPRRRFYRLTAVGIARTKSAFREVRTMVGGFAWQKG
jgi:PadR family transcriptional regulator, regulatory protein PadR